MKEAISTILFILAIGPLFSQKIIINESFKSQEFTEKMLVHSEKNKFTDTHVAGFSFSKMGQDDESALRISIKQIGEKKNVKLIFKKIELNKNKTYEISLYTKSRTGRGKFRISTFYRNTDNKFLSLFRKDIKFEKSYNKWHKETFTFKATKKNYNGETLNLKDLNFVINFSGLSRGIYLFDDIVIKQLD